LEDFLKSSFCLCWFLMELKAKVSLNHFNIWTLPIQMAFVVNRRNETIQFLKVSLNIHITSWHELEHFGRRASVKGANIIRVSKPVGLINECAWLWILFVRIRFLRRDIVRMLGGDQIAQNVFANLGKSSLKNPKVEFHPIEI
jgi:hypothetical protein